MLRNILNTIADAIGACICFATVMALAMVFGGM
jgi:hypothetical protein